MTNPDLPAGLVRLDPDAALAPDPDRPGELVSLQYVGDDDRLVAGTWSAGAAGHAADVVADRGHQEDLRHFEQRLTLAYAAACVR